ncbi:MAG TPA: hypothetical protein VH561_13100 [Micromonosporaceae bacterium]
MDAERFDADVRADVSRGVYVDPAAGRVTVNAYGETWRVGRLHADSTAELVERTLRVHVYPVFGGMRTAQVRASTIQAWVKDRAQVLAPSSLRVAYGYLVSTFRAAVIDRVIGVSPCQGIQLPDLPGEDMFIRTAEQIHALSAALAGPGGCPGGYEALPLVGAGTGLRQGEA